MTQEEKELLLKDLCARLPYGVKIQTEITPRKLVAMDLWNEDELPKPYLRPMESITKEEQFQLGRLLGATSYNLLKGKYSPLKELLEYIYKTHIDLFGLISMGLAVAVTEENNPYKQ